MSDRDDVKLLKQIQRGNLPGLIGLYERFGPLVYTLSLRILASAEHAEALTQDLFLDIWESAGTKGRRRGDVFTWILDRCRRKALELRRSKEFRSKSREQEADDGVSSRESPEESAGEAQFADRREQLAGLLKNISKDNLKILKLAYFKGYAPQQIGRMLRTSPGAVRARLTETVNVLRGLGDKKAKSRQDHPLLGQCLPYALGELAGQRLEEFERHVEGCSVCEPELESILSGIHLMPLTLVPRIPPAALRDEMTAKAAGSRPTRAGGVGATGGLRPWMFAAVLGVLVVVMGVSAYIIERLLSGADELKAQVERVSLESFEARRALSVLQRSGTKTQMLIGLSSFAAARGSATWDPASGDVALITKHLPPTAEGESYHLWLLAGGAAVQVGEFVVLPSDVTIEGVHVFKAPPARLANLEEIRVALGAQGTTTSSPDSTCLTSLAR